MKLSYVIFMQFELGKGVQVMCALAAAPSDYLQKIILAQKLVLANKQHSVKPVSKVRILDMMARSNEMFVEAMKGFPEVVSPRRCPTTTPLGTVSR